MEAFDRLNNFRYSHGRSFLQRRLHELFPGRFCTEWSSFIDFSLLKGDLSQKNYFNLDGLVELSSSS